MPLGSPEYFPEQVALAVRPQQRVHHVLALRITRGQILDGVCVDFPDVLCCIGRVYFARSPSNDIWVLFCDLPDATRQAAKWPIVAAAKSTREKRTGSCGWRLQGHGCPVVVNGTACGAIAGRKRYRGIVSGP